MRNVTTHCESYETGDKVVVKIYKEKRWDLMDILFVALMTMAILVVSFYAGVYVGAKETVKQVAETTTEAITEEVSEVEVDIYSPAVPLSYTEQHDLYDAAAEFGVDYNIMLGLIENETNFRNVYGDGGNASGYCQIWKVYWKDLMNDIGASDLNIPKDNFRTACAIMRELTNRYGSVSGALTAYNKGSFDGTVTTYATRVLENAEKWRGI